MEQEPEEAHQALEFEKKVRAEINFGSQQIKTIEDQLRDAPQGFLGRADGTDAQFLRANILGASASVVGSFTKIISLLSAYSCLDRHGSGGESGVGGSAERKSDSPMSSAHMRGTTPPASPHRGPSGAPASSPCNTPLSGSGMSDSSPPNPASSPLSLDYDVEAASGPVGASGRGRQAATNEGSTSADHDLSEQPAPRKRKFMPKYSIKQRGTGTDLGSDGPPEDGFTWRKYGQKDILGSKYPRSYYRCTRKNDDGCPAIKNVQRSDEDPSMFDVTYRGTHTCQSSRQYSMSSWPFSVPELFARILAESRESQDRLPTRELTLQDYTGRRASGIVEDPIEGLSPIIPLPGQSSVTRLEQAVYGTPPPFTSGGGSSSSTGMGTSVKPEVNNPSQQRISNIANTPIDSIFEPPPNTMPFPAFSGGQSEGYSSPLTDNSMPMPTAARMDNQNAHIMSQNPWAGQSSLHNSRWGENPQQSGEFRPPQEQLHDPAGLYRFAGGSRSISDNEYSHPIDPMRGPGQLIVPIGDMENLAYAPPGMSFFDGMEYEQIMRPFSGST